MTRSKSKSKVLHVSLWIVQILLSLTLIWSSAMKLFQSPKELSAMWPWAGEVSVGLVKITGIVDLLGALGLILPMLLRIKPILTVANSRSSFSHTRLTGHIRSYHQSLLHKIKRDGF
jgi:hypothetical protein